MSGIHTVAVTAATGKTGRHVSREAAARGWRVRCATRRRAAPGEWVPLDWNDERTWAPAFSGSDAAYVIVPFTGAGAAQATPRLLQAAAANGVDRIVLLSSMDAHNAAAESPLRLAETALERLPVRSAILRPTWFLDNFTTGSFAAMTRAGELRLPAGAGMIPFIDVRDVAAVAAAALAPDGPQGILPLTGPEQLSHQQVATALGHALGRAVHYRSVGPDEFVAWFAGQGFPRSYAQFLATALADVAAGRLPIPVTDTVERITGRRPRTVREFAQHHAAQAT